MMLNPRLISFIRVAETGSFSKAAKQLALTQPAVSQHIRALEDELGVHLFERSSNELHITHEGEMVLKFARRSQSLYNNLMRDLLSQKKQITALTVGITHTAESNAIAETLAKYVNSHKGFSVKIVTDTLQNLYDMLNNYEIDMAIVEGKINDPSLKCLMLDTDCLVLAVSPEHHLAHKSMVTINELKKERMILRLPNSGTRTMFTSAIGSKGMSMSDFNVVMEIDNIATIKDLVRRDFGVSVLAKSACLDELRKGKITVLPIEDLSMMREINIVYSEDFDHFEVLRDLVQDYNDARGKPAK